MFSCWKSSLCSSRCLVLRWYWHHDRNCTLVCLLARSPFPQKSWSHNVRISELVSSDYKVISLFSCKLQLNFKMFTLGQMLLSWSVGPQHAAITGLPSDSTLKVSFTCFGNNLSVVLSMKESLVCRFLGKECAAAPVSECWSLTPLCSWYENISHLNGKQKCDANAKIINLNYFAGDFQKKNSDCFLLSSSFFGQKKGTLMCYRHNWICCGLANG